MKEAKNIFKGFVYGLLILGLIFCLNASISASPCGCDTGTYNYTCGETVNESCTLNCNLTSTGTCFTIGANDITIDGAGYSIMGDATGDGIYLNGRNNVTIKNFSIYNLSHGIYLKSGLWDNVKHLGIYGGIFDYNAALGVNNYYSQDMQHRLGVSAGAAHTCILKSNGNVDCYGSNYDTSYPGDNWAGQASDYTGGDAIGVSAGGYHTCVLKSNGNVDCYGSSYYGQSNDYTGGDAIGVSAGGAHTCVLKSNGNVDCYGFNDDGQSNDYTGGDAIGVSAGTWHTCILKSNGNVHCYGFNDYGQSNDYTGGDAIGVATGARHTCILKSNGNVHCYGLNNNGQSNDYTGGDAIGVAAAGNTCILKSNGNVHCYGWNYYGQSNDYTDGDAIGLSAGRDHTCILKSNGNVHCYGKNDDGQANDYNGGDAKRFKKTSIINFIIHNNSISNCDYGIYSQDSNSIIHSNIVCNNTNNDFYSPDWFSSSGDDNTCDNPDGWNDDGTTGCTYACASQSDGVCYCSNCDDCEERLNDPVCSEVRLDADITNYAGTCINNPLHFNNKIFDCKGHKIAGDGVGGNDYGIYLNGKSNNTLRNCIITGFYYGIYLDSSSNNTVINNIVNDNKGEGGIVLDSSSNNTLTSNTANSNGWHGGIYLDSSSYNTLTSNIANDNHKGISLWQSSNNTITKNTVHSNDYLGIVLWNDSNFNDILDNDVLDNDIGIRITNCEPSGDFCLEGNTDNTIQGNEISNNEIGILSEDSNSTINSNIVCGNTYLDFSSSDWKSSYGNNNFCDKTDGWNDTGATGCTYVCPYCSICDECEEKLNSTKLKDNTLYLTANITSYAGTCINNPEKFNNKIFDCQGHTIDGDGSGNWNNPTYGIYLNGKSNNTIKNCVITDFYEGIYLDSSSKNSIINNIANSNDWLGILLSSSSNNKITGCTANNNGWGFYLDSSSSNTLTSNIVNNNYDYGIRLRSSSSNNIIDNTVNSNSDGGIWLWNDSNFNEILNNEILNNGRAGITISDCEYWEEVCFRGNTDNIIQGNEISNNDYGIYSSKSTSTINSNIVCENTNSDFSSPDWQSSSGDNNFCDKTDGWNDTGKTGCAHPCPCYCDSCVNCTIKLNDPSCEYVMLNTNILNHAGDCIYNPANFVNKTFDCQGNTIDGTGSGFGIYLEGKSGNTIKNCVITDFAYGLYFNGSSHNDIIANMVKLNNNSGIHLHSSSHNNITNNQVYQNKGDGVHLHSSSYNNFLNNQIQYSEQDGLYFSSDSNNNNLTSNTVCSSNNFDINDEDSNSGGINNTCNETNNYNDAGKNKCTYGCIPLPDLEVSKLYLSLPSPGNLQVCTEIKNPVKGTADNVKVSLYVDNKLTDYKIIPSFGPNSTEFVCLLWIAESGTHELRVVVDPENLIEELYEDNNEISEKIKSTVFCFHDSDCNDNNPETDDICIQGVCNNMGILGKKIIKPSPEINKATVDTTVHFYFIIDMVGSLCENHGGTIGEFYDSHVREYNNPPPRCKGVKVYMNVKSPTYGSTRPAEGTMLSNGVVDVPVRFKDYGDTGTYEVSLGKITVIDSSGNTKEYTLLQKHYLFDVVEEELDINTGIATEGYAKLSAGWEWGVTVGILKISAGVGGYAGLKSEIPRGYTVKYRGDDSYPYSDIESSPLELQIGRETTAYAGVAGEVKEELTIIKDKLSQKGGIEAGVEVSGSVYESDVFEFANLSEDGPAFYIGSAMMVFPDPLSPLLPIYYNDIAGPGLCALAGLDDYKKAKTVGLSTGIKGELTGGIGGEVGLGGELSAQGSASAKMGSEQILTGSLLNPENTGFCSYNSLEAGLGAGAKIGYEKKEDDKKKDKKKDDKKGAPEYEGGLGIGLDIIKVTDDNKICYDGIEEELELTLTGAGEEIKYIFDADDMSNTESNEINNIKDAYNGSIGKRAYLALLAGFVNSDIINNIGNAEPVYEKSEVNEFMYNLMLSAGVKAGVIGGEIGAGGKLFGGITNVFEKGIRSEDLGEFPVYERPLKNYNELEVLLISGLFTEKVYIEGVIDNLDDIALKVVSDLAGALTKIIDCISNPGKCVQDVVTGAWNVITDIGGTIVSVLSKLKFWDQHLHVIDEYGREIYYDYSYREYLFSWDDVPGNNTDLLNFLDDTLKIEWLENATINKSVDDTTITVTDGNNTLLFTLNETHNESENKVTLEINGREGYDEYISKYENGTLNIYLSGRFVNEIPGAFIIRTITEEQIENYTNSTNVTYHIHESVFIPEGIKFKVYIDAGEAHNITEPYKLVATTHDTETNITSTNIIEDIITQNATIQYTIDTNILKINGTVTNITTKITDRTTEICGNGICNASANETIENCPLDCDTKPPVIHSANIEIEEDINKMIRIIVNASDNLVTPLVFVNASSSTGNEKIQLDYDEESELYYGEFFVLQSDIFNFTILAYDNVKKQPTSLKLAPVTITVNVSDWYVKALNITLPYNITYYQNNVPVDEIEGWNPFNVTLNFTNFTLEFYNVSAKRLQPTKLPIVYPILNVLLNETFTGEEILAKDELLYINPPSFSSFFGENATYNTVLKMRRTDPFSDVIKCDKILFGKCVNLQIIPEQNYSVAGEWIVMNVSSFSTYGIVNMRPDLRPISMVYTPKYPELNQEATVSSIVENRGFLDAAGVNISLFVDNVYYSSQIIDLSSLSQKTINFTWNVQDGVHNITIKVDPDNNIQESEEDNNEISMLMGISPDLIPNSITYSDLTENKKSVITAEIQNLGTKDANNTKISFIIDNTEINSSTVTISASSSVNVTFNWTATAAGIYNLTIAADPENEINETNEGNNNLTVQIFVMDAFVSDDVKLTAPSEVVFGAAFDVSLFIKNTGTLDLENLHSSLSLSSKFNTTNSTEIDIGNLSVSEERTINWTLKGVESGYGEIVINITSNGNQIDVISKDIKVLAVGPTPTPTPTPSPVVRRGGGVPRDSDNDGLSDVEEMLKGTDPNNPDTDGDGIIDSVDPYPLDPALPAKPAVTPTPSVTLPSKPMETPAPVPTPTKTPEATPKPIPGFEAILWLLAIAIAMLIGYLSRFKRRK